MTTALAAAIIIGVDTAVLVSVIITLAQSIDETEALLAKYADHGEIPSNVPRGYVTTSGFLEIPERVRDDMEIGPGDYLFFAKGDDGYWNVMGPKEWDELMGDIVETPRGTH